MHILGAGTSRPTKSAWKFYLRISYNFNTTPRTDAGMRTRENVHAGHSAHPRSLGETRIQRRISIGRSCLEQREYMHVSLIVQLCGMQIFDMNRTRKKQRRTDALNGVPLVSI